MHNIRIYGTAKGNIHYCAYLAALITGYAGTHLICLSLPGETGQVGICDQGADHLDAIGLPFGQDSLGLGSCHDAATGKDGNSYRCFDQGRKLNCIARWCVHRGMKREHLCAKNTPHGNGQIVNTASCCEHACYFAALFGCKASPRSKFVCAEAHAQDLIWPKSGIYGLNGLLHKTQPVLQCAAVAITALISQW